MTANAAWLEVLGIFAAGFGLASLLWLLVRKRAVRTAFEAGLQFSAGERQLELERHQQELETYLLKLRKEEQAHAVAQARNEALSNQLHQLQADFNLLTREFQTARSEQAAAAQVAQLESGATPGQRSAAQGGVTLALANVEVAKAQLALVQAGATDEQIRQAEVSVEQAKASIKIAEAGVLQAEAAVTQADAGVKAAEAGLAAADLALSRTEIKSPIGGIVSSVNIDVGELANPGVPVVVVADFGEWEIKTTDLTELDVARVAERAPVSIEFDAIPNETLEGVVTDVALISSVSQGDVVYEVTIALVDTQGLPIRWGMTAFVNVDR